MADRKVSASLTLEARQFRAEAKAAIDEMEKLAKSGKLADSELGRMQDATNKAGASLLRLAADGRLTTAELKKAESQVDELRGSLMELGGATHLEGADAQVKLLELEIDKAKRKMAELSAEFRRTGSASSLSGFKDAEASLKKLESTLGEVKRVIGGQNNSGGSFISRLIGNVSDLPDKLLGKNFSGQLDQQLAKGFEMSLTNPYVLGIAAAAAAPLGVAVGGAILTGIGLVGIGAGIAGQLHDPQVEKAAKNLEAQLSLGFHDVTSSFVGPLLDGLHTFDTEWSKLKPGLRSTFTDLAPLTRDLSAGAAGFVDKLVPGLERAAVASKPLVQDLSMWLPRLGSELGGVFDTIASHESEAEAGLNMLTKSLDFFLTTASTGITITSWLFDASKLTGLGVGYLSAGEDAQKGADGTKAFQDALQATLPPLNAATDGLAELNAQYRDYVNDLLGSDRAALQFKTDMAGLSDALSGHTRTLDENTAAGRQNAGTLLDLVADAEAQRDAAIAAGNGTQEATDTANAAYKRQIGQIEALAIKLGLPISQVQALIDKYKELQHAPNIYKSVNITIREHVNDGSYYQTPYGKALLPSQYGGIQHFAGGGVFAAGSAGIVSGGGPYAMFGEPGTGASTEGFLPRSGISQARAGGLLDTMAGWYGYGLTGAGRGGDGAAVQVAITVSDDSGKMLKVIRSAVRAGGGNASVVLGGSRSA